MYWNLYGSAASPPFSRLIETWDVLKWTVYDNAFFMQQGLIETWDVLKSRQAGIMEERMKINRNMRCIEIFI